MIHHRQLALVLRWSEDDLCEIAAKLSNGLQNAARRQYCADLL